MTCFYYCYYCCYYFFSSGKSHCDTMCAWAFWLTRAINLINKAASIVGEVLVLVATLIMVKELLMKWISA